MMEQEWKREVWVSAIRDNIAQLERLVHDADLMFESLLTTEGIASDVAFLDLMETLGSIAQTRDKIEDQLRFEKPPTPIKKPQMLLDLG